MKHYAITIPAYTLHIEAKNEREALEQFWFDYDCAQEDSEWQKPIVTRDLNKRVSPTPI